MPDADLGPKPDPVIEPGEPNPGGPDAIAHGDGVDGELATGDPVPADLPPDDNPAVEDALSDDGDDGAVEEDMKEGEDTSTEATRSESDEDNTGAADEADRENPA